MTMTSMLDAIGNRNVHRVIFLLLGFAAFLLLQLQYVLFWVPFYSNSPLPGYERAMAAGQIAPFFTATRQTMMAAAVVLFLLPMVSLFWARPVARKLNASVALWAGIMLGVVVVWISIPRLRNDSDMWPIDLVFLAFTTGLPMIAGTLVHLALAEFVFRKP